MSTANTSAPTTGAFSPRVVLALIVVGVVAFAAFLVLSTYAPDLDAGRDGGGHALSRSAVGFAALERLVRAEGSPTVISREAQAPTEGLWVLTPPTGADFDDRLDALNGPVLVVLPKWNVMRDERRAGWVRNGGPASESELVQLLALLAPAAGQPEADGKPDASTPTVTRRSGREAVTLVGAGGLFDPSSRFAYSGVDRLQTLAGGAFTPILTDENGRTVLAQLPAPRQQVYVLADPDLLNTHGLRNSGDARSAVILVRSLAGGQAVTFDVTLNGFERGRGILRAAFEPPFLGATLCLVAAALLMGLHAAIRFGPAARPGRVFALGKAALADNAAGLIALAGREAAMTPAYAADTRARVAAEIGAPRELSGKALDTFLDRIGTTLGVTEPWSSLRAAAGDAGTRDSGLDVARRLSRWRMEMTRGRR